MREYLLPYRDGRVAQLTSEKTQRGVRGLSKVMTMQYDEQKLQAFCKIEPLLNKHLGDVLHKKTV